MATQELQWLAVPYDVEQRDGRTYLSVAISVTPKLQEATTAPRTLADYPDWVNWPETLKNIKVTLDFDGLKVKPSSMTVKNEPADPETWEAIFQKTTFVNPFEYKPFTNYKLVSFPVKGVLASVNSAYVKLAKEFATAPKIDMIKSVTKDTKSSFGGPAALPKVMDLMKDLTPNDEDENNLRQLKSSFEKDGMASTARRMNQSETSKNPVRTIKGGQVEVPSNPETMMFKPVNMSTPVGGLLMAEVFHTARDYSKDKPGVGKGAKVQRRVERPKIARPTYDFHQVVSLMREYPIMLRKLGIVQHVEFEIPSGFDDVSIVRCLVDFPSPQLPGTKNTSPWVAYRLDRSGAPQYWQFLPRPLPDSEIKGAVLCLDDASHFDIIQVDVDAAAMKTLQYTRGMLHRAKKTFNTRDSASDASPPAVRGTGLQLIRVNRGLKLAKAIIRNAQNYNKLVSNTEVTLYADDLLRGFRVDVWDDVSKKWHSLMRRNATYTFPKATGALKTTGVTVLDEEGVMTFGASRPVGSDDTPSMRALYAHETVMQWEGWSLVAPLIGQHIGTEDELAPEQKKASPPPDFEYQIESAVTVVKNSLPRLRYGRGYRMRARVVDVVGNGPLLNELAPDDISCTTALVRYLRWDPISSPMLALRKHPVEGESLERMVVRNYNASENDADEVATTETSERHVFPPLAAQQTCERHGLFDVTPTDKLKGDVSTYDLIVKKSGQLPSRWYTRTATGDLKPEATDNVPPAGDAKENAINYPYVPGASAAPPYLPDPLARGLTLSGVPGVASGQLMEVTLSGVNAASISSSTGVASIVFDGMDVWPEIRSIIIKLAEGTGAPTWDAAQRTLTILLPKGEQAWILFSSSLGEKQAEADTNLSLLGHKGTLQAAGIAAGAMAAASRGLNWLITPGRTLHLVHATQKPLKKPEVKTAKVALREFGSTSATIDITETYVHGRTTQKIDMNAEWLMKEDNLNKKGPEDLQQQSYFYEQHVEDRLVDKLANEKTQEFGDTKHRHITYIPTATTRFREYLAETLRKDPANLTRKGIGKALHVLSTKRPDAVKLLYVIPSFTWVEEEKKLVGNSVTSTRKGGGLRVWMERPWYSSGNEEMVGIILYTGQKFKPGSGGGGGKDFKGNFYSKGYGIGATKGTVLSGLTNAKVDIPESHSPYVTQWGLDPVWLSAPTPSDSTPVVANFSDADHVESGVSLDELGVTERFTVVAYKPKYDEDRQLWYCDVTIDPGQSYYPFIRLALVRFQPYSLDDDATGRDVYCSRAVLSEFCQLAPDRQATATIDADRQSINIQVVGPTYRINTTGQTGSDVEVTIEKRDAAAGGEDIGWTPVITQRLDRLSAANMWGGTLRVPSGIDGVQHRVVIKEYEQFYSDPLDNRKREGSLGLKSASGGGDMEFTLDRRIVYADVLPLY